MNFLKIDYENHVYLINVNNINACNFYEVVIDGKEKEKWLEIYVNGSLPLKLKGKIASDTFETICTIVERG